MEKPSKKELENKIKELEKELDKSKEDQKIVFTKKELQDFIKEEVKENLSVEVKEKENYQYGGGYKTMKTVEVFWDGNKVYESSSFE
jgi:type IV secretory pathway VirB9-like protein